MRNGAIGIERLRSSISRNKTKSDYKILSMENLIMNLGGKRVKHLLKCVRILKLKMQIKINVKNRIPVKYQCQFV